MTRSSPDSCSPRSARNACRVGGLERRDLELDLRADRNGGVSPRARETPSSPRRGARRSTLAASRDVGLVEVDDDEERLGREQLKAAQPPQVVAGEAERAQRLAVLERRPCSAGSGRAPSRGRRTCSSSDPSRAARAALDDAEVGEDQLVFHRLRVARRIDRSRRDAAPPRRETRARRAPARRRSCSRRRRPAPRRRCGPARRCR